MGSFYLYPNKCLPRARENFLGHRHEEQGGACGWQTGGGGGLGRKGCDVKSWTRRGNASPGTSPQSVRGLFGKLRSFRVKNFNTAFECLANGVIRGTEENPGDNVWGHWSLWTCQWRLILLRIVLGGSSSHGLLLSPPRFMVTPPTHTQVRGPQL